MYPLYGEWFTTKSTSNCLVQGFFYQERVFQIVNILFYSVSFYGYHLCRLKGIGYSRWIGSSTNPTRLVRAPILSFLQDYADGCAKLRHADRWFHTNHANSQYSFLPFKDYIRVLFLILVSYFTPWI